MKTEPVVSIAICLALAALAACVDGETLRATDAAQAPDNPKSIESIPAAEYPAASKAEAPSFDRTILPPDASYFDGAVECAKESVVSFDGATLRLDLGASPRNITVKAVGDPEALGWSPAFSLAAGDVELPGPFIHLTVLSTDTFAAARMENVEGRAFAITRLYAVTNGVEELPQEMYEALAKGVTERAVSAYRDPESSQAAVFTTRIGATVEVIALRFARDRAYALVISEIGLCGWSPLAELPPLEPSAGPSPNRRASIFSGLIDLGGLSVSPGLLVEDHTEAAQAESDSGIAAVFKTSPDGAEWYYHSFITEYGWESSYLERSPFRFGEVSAAYAPGNGMLYVKSILLVDGDRAGSSVVRKFRDDGSLEEFSQPFLFVAGMDKLEYTDTRLYLDSKRRIPYALSAYSPYMQLMGVAPGEFGVVSMAGIVLFVDSDDATIPYPSGP
jgi:hypothetical protein